MRAECGDPAGRELHGRGALRLRPSPPAQNFEHNLPFARGKRARGSACTHAGDYCPRLKA